MIGELVDSFVSVFSPRRAFDRARARQAYNVVSKRAYEAARVDRTTTAWNAQNQSADRALMGEAERVRDRARDLVRNNAYARGALDAIVSNVVGCGIVPKPATDSATDNDLIQEAWNRWCEVADVTGRLHFYEMQALACREMVESGEAIVHYVSDLDETRPCPFALEMIESERISTESDVYKRQREGNQVRRGVELDATGKPVAYWLWNASPNGFFYEQAAPERREARDYLHIYRQERIGQTRGVSWLAPAVLWLKDLGMYVENELQASAVASCFGVVVKTIDGGDSFGGMATPTDGETTDTDGNRLERIQPGLVTHLMPGEDIECINPGRPNAAADPWISLILRSIAVAMGISYELVSRDYSRTNYSSNRASALEDRRRFKPMQKFLVWHLCQPVYREFFASCVLARVKGFPDETEFLSNQAYWLKCNWRTPGWEWVDPLKEIQAAALAVKEKFTSRGDVIESAGDDLRETWKELAAENKLAEELDLDLTPELTLIEANSKINEEEPADAETANA